jgi:uroporphyrinogen-III synthase
VAALPSVWVTRPAPGNAVSVRALTEAGLSVIAAPVLIVRSLRAAALPAEEPPDWIVFVSANAVLSFEDALCRAPAIRMARSAVRAAAVGRRTAESAAASSWRVEATPEEETADGLLGALLAHDLRGRRVWIPSGNREGSATRTLPEALTERGADVSVFQVYETVDRELSLPEQTNLDRAIPGAIVLHSPSAVEAVFAAGGCAAAARWRAEAVAVSIGPATSRRLSDLGAKRVAQCLQPSDTAVAAAVFALDAFKTSRSTS